MPERIRHRQLASRYTRLVAGLSQFALGAAEATRVVGPCGHGAGMNLGSLAELASQISEGRWLIVADTLAPDLSSRISLSLLAGICRARRGAETTDWFLILACLPVASPSPCCCPINTPR